jgi:hypothetical protein
VNRVSSKGIGSSPIAVAVAVVFSLLLLSHALGLHFRRTPLRLLGFERLRVPSLEESVAITPYTKSSLVSSIRKIRNRNDVFQSFFKIVGGEFLVFVSEKQKSKKCVSRVVDLFFGAFTTTTTTFFRIFFLKSCG